MTDRPREDAGLIQVTVRFEVIDGKVCLLLEQWFMLESGISAAWLMAVLFVGTSVASEEPKLKLQSQRHDL